MILSKHHVKNFENLSDEQMENFKAIATNETTDTLLKSYPNLKLALIVILEVVIKIPFIGSGWKAAATILLISLKTIN